MFDLMYFNTYIFFKLNSIKSHCIGGLLEPVRNGKCSQHTRRMFQEPAEWYLRSELNRICRWGGSNRGGFDGMSAVIRVEFYLFPSRARGGRAINASTCHVGNGVFDKFPVITSTLLRPNRNRTLFPISCSPVKPYLNRAVTTEILCSVKRIKHNRTNRVGVPENPLKPALAKFEFNQEPFQIPWMLKIYRRRKANQTR